ncbi:MAG TPA: GntR family transcriptional regulator [Terriglobales bacterium]|nr:GntR family transcriptional regulator [Terriglobales bacterium]
MPLTATKLNTQPARHQVAGKIREAILDGSLIPGERLVERKLAEALGTSQSAIREALIQLELEGHVSKKPNSATYVTDFSQRDLENTIAVRRALESFAAEEAARQRTQADIERMQDLFHESTAAARSRDFQKYIRGDLIWHISMWESTHNDCLVETLRRVVVPLFGFSAIRVAMQPGFNLAKDLQLHKALLDAIVAGEPERAKRAFHAAMQDWTDQAVHLYSEEEASEETPETVAE